MTKRIDSIVIVGGGTSGWLTAAYLARRLGSHAADGVRITLVEASDIPTIGVGEGTFPSLRTTMATIGIDEADFLRESGCTFKQGITFANWLHDPAKKGGHHYHHLFNFPHVMGGAIDLAPYWLLDQMPKGHEFATSNTTQVPICTSAKGPKRITDKPYSGPFNYAYHFDAGRFASCLKNVAIGLGVNHKVGTVTQVGRCENGDISHLVLQDDERLQGDLFIDCSGFFGVLIDKTLKAKRHDVSDTLFVDRALAVQVPYETADTPIASTTMSTAQTAGWTWDIGLTERRGVGYVYSSAHSSDDEAAAVLSDYLGPAAQNLSFRQLRMSTGYCQTPWIGNCVAVGLAGGFLEPLEATGIAMIEAAIRLIADYFPRDGEIEPVADLFNRAMNARYENAVEFIKMHYCLTQRTDSAFWRDNVSPEGIPDSLQEKLRIWRSHVPNHSDFDNVHFMFRRESYQFVLFGMGRHPDLSGNLSAYPYRREAAAELQRTAAAAQRGHDAMPDHRALLDDIYRNGFQPGTAGGQ